MSQLLDQVIEEMRKLSAPEQDAIAAVILEELADERRWDDAFARSQEQLARLAGKVRADVRGGRVEGVEIERP